MEKELKIKVKISTSFEVEANPNLKNWEDATDDERVYYVKNCVRTFLLEQVDDIIDDLMNDSKIEF